MNEQQKEGMKETRKGTTVDKRKKGEQKNN